MEKIYGYKEKDLIGLAEYIRARKNESLTAVFKDYALKYGKAKGTVRNMYYALCKACEKDTALKEKYFNETPVQVNKIIEFKPCETRALVRAILVAKNQGRSARGVVMELANGDVKLALRYQNKYRSVLRTNPKLIDELMAELGINPILKTDKNKSKIVSDFQLNKLKREIDGLVERLSERALKENQRLKSRIAFLEAENLRLTKSLYSSSSAVDTLSKLRKNTDMVN